MHVKRKEEDSDQQRQYKDTKRKTTAGENVGDVAYRATGAIVQYHFCSSRHQCFTGIAISAASGGGSYQTRYNT